MRTALFSENRSKYIKCPPPYPSLTVSNLLSLSPLQNLDNNLYFSFLNFQFTSSMCLRTWKFSLFVLTGNYGYTVEYYLSWRRVLSYLLAEIISRSKNVFTPKRSLALAAAILWKCLTVRSFSGRYTSILKYFHRRNVWKILLCAGFALHTHHTWFKIE